MPIQAKQDDTRPLAGKRILVTRAKPQAAELSALLAALGAVPVELPTIEIVPRDIDKLDAALKDMGVYDWVVLTSVNAVEILFARVSALRKDASVLKGVRFAAIGEGTAAALRAFGIVPDVVPPEFIAESLAGEIAKTGSVAGKRFLLPRAAGARSVLVEQLKGAGAFVDEIQIYSSERARPSDAEVDAALTGLDAVTLTSSSMASNFAAIIGAERLARVFGPTATSRPLVATIGPITSNTSREVGLPVDAEAEVHSIPGLVDTLARHYARSRNTGDTR